MDDDKALTNSESIRDVKKQKILDVLSRINVVSTACLQAGITRETFYHWCKSGFISKEELTECFESYCDGLRTEL